MYHRLCSPLISKSFFVFGARGTGKTQLLLDLFRGQNVLWIDLLKQGELLQFLRNPGELRARLDAATSIPEWVIVDEIQRVPTLLNEVHSLIEERKQKFALTGSSARKLKRGAANLLAGRALLNNLYPLTFRELGDDFSLETALNWGTLPAVITEPDDLVRSEQLKSYVETYLREEIREEQIVRQLDPFARFLEVAAQTSGTIVNLSRLGREALIDAKATARYFQILEDTLLGYFLEPYHRSIRKRQRQQAKFYLFDIGVKRALEGALRTSIRPRTYEWGVAFEHLVILELHRINSYLRADYKFSYLKTNNQAEIDLIAERRGGKTWAIEIKSTANPDLADIHALGRLAEAIPNCQPAIFCTTERDKVVGEVKIVNWQTGIDQLFQS